MRVSKLPTDYSIMPPQGRHVIHSSWGSSPHTLISKLGLLRVSLNYLVESVKSWAVQGLLTVLALEEADTITSFHQDWYHGAVEQGYHILVFEEFFHEGLV